MLRIEIDPALTLQFPQIHVSAMRVTALDVASHRLAASPVLAATAAAVAADYGGDGEKLTADPRIAVWREAYRRVNAKPSKYRSSIEALARRALRGQALDTGLAVVDLYNAVSLQHRAPLGAADSARVPGDTIVLRFSRPSDRFEPIGNHPDGFAVVPPVAVYAAGDEILCWGFNCRDSAKTALDESTAEAVFVAESIDLTQRECATNALRDLAQRFRDAGADVSIIATTGEGSSLTI